MTLDQKLLLVWEYEGGGSSSTERNSMMAFQPRRRPPEVRPWRGETLKTLKRATPKTPVTTPAR